MNKEEMRQFKSLLKQGILRHINVSLDYKFQSALLEIINDYEKLEQENKKLKEDMKVLFEENNSKEKVIIKYQDNLNELKKHIKTCINDAKQNNVYDRTSYEQGVITGLESCLFKIQELEDK